MGRDCGAIVIEVHYAVSVIFDSQYRTVMLRVSEGGIIWWSETMLSDGRAAEIAQPQRTLVPAPAQRSVGAQSSRGSTIDRHPIGTAYRILHKGSVSKHMRRAH